MLHPGSSNYGFAGITMKDVMRYISKIKKQKNMSVKVMNLNIGR
jgi:hypothetical protein